jgi:hypothetical protein
VSTWASDFLQEDNDMTDPLFHPRRWAQQTADARLAALNALSAAAHKGRDAEAERRALTPDECYGRDVLLNAGICPECLYQFEHCECEQTPADIAALNQDDDAGDSDGR